MSPIVTYDVHVHIRLPIFFMQGATTLQWDFNKINTELISLRDRHSRVVYTRNVI